MCNDGFPGAKQYTEIDIRTPTCPWEYTFCLHGATNRSIALLGFALLITGCSKQSILGPSDKPDFAGKPWTSMEISYWVKVSERKKLRRVFRIDDPACLRRGFTSLREARVEGANLPAPSKQLALSTSDGERWFAHVVFEDKVAFCLASKKYYSYDVFTKEYQFYNWLINLCLTNERQMHVEATRRHIILRSNLALSAYEVLPEAGDGPAQAEEAR